MGTLTQEITWGYDRRVGGKGEEVTIEEEGEFYRARTSGADGGGESAEAAALCCMCYLGSQTCEAKRRRYTQGKMWGGGGGGGGALFASRASVHPGVVTW